MMEEITCKPDYSNSMAEHLGIRFLPPTENAVRNAEMPVSHRTSQPFGMLNGGASLALAEYQRRQAPCRYAGKANMPAEYK